MPQLEQVPRQYVEELGSHATETNITHSPLTLKSTDSAETAHFTFEAIRPNVFRTTFSSPSHPIPPHPSVLRPETLPSDVKVNVKSGERFRELTIGAVTATVEWADAPVVSLSLGGEMLHRDLPYRSYALDGNGIAHYTWYRRDSLHVGLGEKAAPMNLSNRHFQIAATDSFGYDAYRTDPLYKHIPLLINATPKGCIAMFSTSHSRASWAVGSEIEGLWGHFKVYRQDYGGLEEYLIVGRTIKEVVHSYAQLAGFPLLVPRWALGYLGGGMKYGMLDEPRACDAHLEFVSQCKKHQIPCSGFQMSSGYTISEFEPKTRNVFTWNHHRFPDPRDFTRKMHAQGVRLIANVKPYVLANHPSYDALRKGGALFYDPQQSQSAIARLWSAGGGESGEGGHIDFTSQEGYQWWFKGIQGLREVGIDAIWNDNNEFCIPDDRWELSLQNQSSGTEVLDKSIGLWGRAVHTEIMAKSSSEALKSIEPGVRPFVLSRSATAGTMRYAASSWSGDNVTSWDGMKGANAISLNAGMSLLQCYGHDIGGFEGEQPTPELLLRWVQLGVYSPRFAINCFKTAPDNNLVGEVIEPWMYPEITHLIRQAIQRRYELIPYLYSLTLESHLTANPPQRWVGWGYENDPIVWEGELLDGEKQYWLGDTLLIGGVFQPGESSAKMYLPKKEEESCQSNIVNGATNDIVDIENEAYINLNSPYQRFPSGQWINIEAHWQNSIPIIAKVGGALPVGKPVPTACSLPLESREEFPSLVPDDYRGIEIFPPNGSSHGRRWTNTWFEDDGLSAQEQISEFQIIYWSTESEVQVIFSAKSTNKFVPAWRELTVILPAGDKRVVRLHDNISICIDEGEDSCGRRRFKFSI